MASPARLLFHTQELGQRGLQQPALRFVVGLGRSGIRSSGNGTTGNRVSCARGAANRRQPRTRQPIGDSHDPGLRRTTAPLGRASAEQGVARRRPLSKLGDFPPDTSDRLPRCLGHQSAVVGDRGQSETHPDHAGGIGWFGAMNAGVDAAFSARRQQDLVHTELLGILTVEFGRLAEREGKIGGPT